jgi:hypothetical protein
VSVTCRSRVGHVSVTYRSRIGQCQSRAPSRRRRRPLSAVTQIAGIQVDVWLGPIPRTRHTPQKERQDPTCKPFRSHQRLPGSTRHGPRTFQDEVNVLCALKVSASCFEILTVDHAGGQSVWKRPFLGLAAVSEELPHKYTNFKYYTGKLNLCKII